MEKVYAIIYESYPDSGGVLGNTVHLTEEGAHQKMEYVASLIEDALEQEGDETHRQMYRLSLKYGFDYDPINGVSFHVQTLDVPATLPLYHPTHQPNPLT